VDLASVLPDWLGLHITVSNEAEADHPKQSPAPDRRLARRQSIRRSVMRLVLVPGVVAILLWLVAAGYLVFNGFYEREVANGVRQVSIPAVTALAAIQRERQTSIAYLAHSAKDLDALIAQRRQTDDQITRLRETAEPILGSAPKAIATRWATLAQHLNGLAGTRSALDAGSGTRQQVYDFYNGLLDAATNLFDTQARVVPDAEAVQGGLTATAAFRAGDLMSRSGSIMAGAFGAKTLSRADYLQFVDQVGAYHAELDTVAPNLTPRARVAYEKVTASQAWADLTRAEEALTTAGPWDRVPRSLPISAARWETAGVQVSDGLLAITTAQADEVSLRTLRAGNAQLLWASAGSLLALLIAVAAILWALRQSQVLVDSALSVRLAQLGKDAAAVVDERLPDMMRRLRQREKVDTAVELPTRDYGEDEIGRLAEVLNRSLHAAVHAAVDEANARAAGTAMLMGVARRPQRPLQQGLKVVEDLQNRIGDEKLLAEVFDINHQLTQTRRFLENLIILAGGQTGRRFQRAVPVRRILLAAVAETQQYQRVTLRHAPDVAVTGTATAGVIHLLAELLDNALAFSPPSSTVWLSCAQADRGVVIEIEDAGVGMVREDLERVNEMLSTAPTPDVTALKDGAQIGMWVVAELARREEIQVTLRTSAYGGLLAIVLLPNRVIASYVDSPTMDLTEQLAQLAAQSAGVSRAAAPAAGRAEVSGAMRKPGGSVAVAPAATKETSRTKDPTAKPPLPQRSPQSHLAPGLRDSEQTGDVAASASPSRSADEARERFASYQRGKLAGRAASDAEPTTSN
jgi:signal transduction histidine kinase